MRREFRPLAIERKTGDANLALIRNDGDATRAQRAGAQFVRYFGPVLDALRALGDSGTSDEVIERIAKDLQLSDSVLNELLPSGDLRYRNQVHWARFYLAREGLIDSSRRGVWSLTENRRKMHLDDTQARALFLKWVCAFQEQHKTRTEDTSAPSDGITPQAGDLPTDYKSKLLGIIQGLSSSGFERLSQRILRESGFSHVEVTGRSGDGGIDGSGTLFFDEFRSWSRVNMAINLHTPPASW